MTVDEIADRMAEQEDPDDILDILNVSSAELVEGLYEHIIKQYKKLNERYSIQDEPYD